MMHDRLPEQLMLQLEPGYTNGIGTIVPRPVHLKCMFTTLPHVCKVQHMLNGTAVADTQPHLIAMLNQDCNM